MLFLALGATHANADEPIKPIEPDGTVNVPAFQLPPSIYLSEQGKKVLRRQPVDFGSQLEKLVRSGKGAAMRVGMAKSRVA